MPLTAAAAPSSSSGDKASRASRARGRAAVGKGRMPGWPAGRNASTRSVGLGYAGLTDAGCRRTLHSASDQPGCPAWLGLAFSTAAAAAVTGRARGTQRGAEAQRARHRCRRSHNGDDDPRELAANPAGEAARHWHRRDTTLHGTVRVDRHSVATSRITTHTATRRGVATAEGLAARDPVLTCRWRDADCRTATPGTAPAARTLCHGEGVVGVVGVKSAALQQRALLPAACL